jgi:hypothetical protein
MTSIYDREREDMCPDPPEPVDPPAEPRSGPSTGSSSGPPAGASRGPIGGMERPGPHGSGGSGRD